MFKFNLEWYDKHTELLVKTTKNELNCLIPLKVQFLGDRLHFSGADEYEKTTINA